MRSARFRKCPRCDGEMRDMGRDRTVVGGTWYVIQCPRCLYVMDVFRPSRGKGARHD